MTGTRMPLLLLSAVWLAGCAGKIPYELAEGQVPEPGLGIVVGSVSAIPAERNPPWYEYSRYEFRSLDDDDVAGAVFSAFDWNPYYMWGTMVLCPEDGLPDECGRLFALQLPAGEYRVEYVTPALSEKTTDQSFMVKGHDLRLQGFDFTVRAGEVAYLGNWVSRICIGGLKRGSRVMAAVGAVADRYERDVPLIIAKYPQLDDVSIANKTIAAPSWLWRYKAGQGFVPPYGWPPECAEDDAGRLHYLGLDQHP